ncbi:aspartic proteinase CDR1-like [Arachis stenosperma]|uniref:aspartic proteinase CDR1-like n=1 Tax=Arachis stenosperma TaxID=217475 RepID=UPI0025ACF273|nr:aspartic proteinase CDR1-like [Arachis stenosperma]
MGGHPRTFQFHACFVGIFFFIHLLHFSTVVEASNNGGFSVKLIRKKLARTTTPYCRRLMDSSKVVQSTSNAYLGHYLMELSIGTPPKTIYGIADTGSDLIWTQCVPCHNCYKQLNPMFDPQQSSTYTNISCESEACHILDTTTLCSSSSSFSAHNDQCNYTYAYASASITQGVLAHEKFTFTSTMGQPISLEGVVFGCGHSNSGDFNDHEMGIIGLGKGPASLISQMGSSFGSKRFSQCLVPFNTDIDVYSKLSFGNGSEVLGEGVVSTPLVTKADDTTPYFVTLLGITVGNTYLPFSNTSSGTVAKGNMFIDSGTPPTILPQDLYDRVVSQMRNQIALRPIEDDHDLGSQLCYRTETIVGGPMIIAHFEGADVQLTQTQIFVPPKDGVQCLGFTNTSSDGGIYGNFAQSNYLIGFDLDRQIVSFKPTDCTKQ